LSALFLLHKTDTFRIFAPMKKCLFACCSVLSVLLTSCSSSSESTQPLLDNSDPFARILVLYDVRSFENGKNFDVAIALLRTQWLDGAPDSTVFPAARIAFRGQAQVQQALINNVTLPWVADSQIPGDAYLANNAQAYGSNDSLQFSYQNYYGESFKNTAAIAKPLGKVTFSSDSISASHPFTVTYDNPVAGDSIEFSIQPVLDTMVFDVGSITVPANRIHYDSTSALYGYTIQLTRKHFTQMLSPSGKLIGIFSDQRLYPALSLPAAK
jgi:hypothetical protein